MAEKESKKVTVNRTYKDTEAVGVAPPVVAHVRKIKKQNLS